MKKSIILIYSISTLAGPVSVPQGGTGLQIGTAYSIIAANSTTSASSLLNISNGTSGQGLMCNGSSAAPSWQSFTPGYASGTFTFAGTSSTVANAAATSVTINTTTPSSYSSGPSSLVSIGHNTLTGLTGASNTSITAVGVNVLPNAPLANNSFLSSTMVGYNSGTAVTNNSGSGTVAVGNYTMSVQTSLPFTPPTGIGNYALQNVGGSSTIATAAGYQALQTVTTATNNLAVGYQAAKNTNINSCSAIGYQALLTNTTGNNNSVIGYQALLNGTTNTGTVILGSGAGTNLTSGNNVVLVGYNAQPITASDTNRIIIGNTGGQASASAYFFGIYGATSASGITTYINSSSQLGTTTSSIYKKENIESIPQEAINNLQELEVKTFNYKNDETKEIHYGLIAEEIEPIFPELVIYDKNNQISSIRYEQLNALLIAHLQQQDKKIEELTTLINLLEEKLNDQR